MAEFVRAQIFGTTFEITSRYASAALVARVAGSTSDKSTRYTDLQPVGMGAFGLVW